MNLGKDHMPQSTPSTLSSNQWCSNPVTVGSIRPAGPSAAPLHWTAMQSEGYSCVGMHLVFTAIAITKCEYELIAPGLDS